MDQTKSKPLPDRRKIPFNPSRHADEDTFVGREDILSQLTNTLYDGFSYGLIGKPGMGKTSLLFALKRNLLQYSTSDLMIKPVPVYIDFGSPNFKSVNSVLKIILEGFVKAIYEQTNFNYPKKIIIQRERFDSPFKSVLDWYYKEFSRTCRLILLFDDLHRSTKYKWLSEVMSILRPVISLTDNMTVVLSGELPLEKNFRDDESILRNLVADQITLPFFTGNDVASLVKLAEKNGWEADKRSEKFAYELTAGHPYRLTFYLFRALRKYGKINPKILQDIHNDVDTHHQIDGMLKQNRLLSKEISAPEQTGAILSESAEKNKTTSKHRELVTDISNTKGDDTMNNSSHIVDFGIVTALPVELNAVLKQLDQVEKIEDQSYDPRTYYRASITTEQNNKYEIVVMMLSKMGNIESALATSDLINRWNPNSIFMVGIAGGIDRTEISLGDIVIAENTLYYEETKIKKSKKEIRPRMIPSDSLLYSRALNSHLENWHSNIDVNSPTPESSNFIPKVHFGPVASGEKVIANKELIKELMQLHPKLLAVEMESAGVSSAITTVVQKIRFLSVRGICDFADHLKDDSWHEFAAHSAAVWAVSFIKSTPVEPTGSIGLEPKPELSSATQDIPDETELFFQIKERFDMEDFKTFCTIILKVDVDEIPGDKKSAKIGELISYSKRKGELNKLQLLFAKYKDKLS